jgi:uncharacterized membrane protein (UPF0127 family)
VEARDTEGMAAKTIALVRADGARVCETCCVADSFLTRFRGLMGRADLPAGEGLLFPGTRSVHTHFMRFAIDVVFLDADDRVVRIVPRLRPWRAAASRDARSVLELRAGECKRRGLCEGARLLRLDGTVDAAA